MIKEMWQNRTMKKLLSVSLLLALALSFVPVFSYAQEGLVPCGGETQPPCDACHVFKLINNIERFLLFPSPFNNGVPPVPAVAAIFLLIGGFYLLTAAGSPEKLQKAKTILAATIVGLIIVYGALLLLGAVLSSAEVAQWGDFRDWVKVECDVQFGPPSP